MKEDWALCVGIGAYGSETKLDPLPGAIEDATAIHAWLTDANGGDVPAAQAKLVLSPDKQKAAAPEPV